MKAAPTLAPSSDHALETDPLSPKLSLTCTSTTSDPTLAPSSAPALETNPLSPKLSLTCTSTRSSDLDSNDASDANDNGLSTVHRNARLRRYRITVAVIATATLVSASVLLSELNAGAAYLELLDRLKAHPGGQGSIIMLGVIATGTVICVSGNFLFLSAGFVVRPYELAVFSAVTGGFLGASMAFAISRFAFRSWVKDEVASRPKWIIIDRAVQRRGFRVMLALRLAMFPFNVGNYLFGALTGVKYVDYLAALVGVMPQLFAFVYFGSLARDMHSISRGEWGGSVEYVVLASITLLGLGGVMIGLFLWARRVVREELHHDG